MHDRSGEASSLSGDPDNVKFQEEEEDRGDEEVETERADEGEIGGGQRSCATVEEMGEAFAGGFEKESLRVRELLKRHFEINGNVSDLAVRNLVAASSMSSW